MLIGLLTAFPMSLALMFGLTDIDAVLKSNLPSAEIFYQITGSRAVVTFMMCWVTLVYFSETFGLVIPVVVDNYLVSLTSQWVTAGRITWAFARDVRHLTVTWPRMLLTPK